VTALAPVLRAALARDGVLPLVSAASPVSGEAGSEERGGVLVLPEGCSSCAGAAETTVAAVREYLASAGAPPRRIVLPGVSEMTVEYPRAPGRMAGKVVVVTGAAQGFGFGNRRGNGAARGPMSRWPISTVRRPKRRRRGSPPSARTAASFR
jgi:hypothetical protein